MKARPPAHSSKPLSPLPSLSSSNAVLLALLLVSRQLFLFLLLPLVESGIKGDRID